MAFLEQRKVLEAEAPVLRADREQANHGRALLDPAEAVGDFDPHPGSEIAAGPEKSAILRGERYIPGSERITRIIVQLGTSGIERHGLHGRLTIGGQEITRDRSP